MRRKRKLAEYTPATRLASMGFCERKIQIESQEEERTTAKQRKAREEGNAAHMRFDAAARANHNAPRSRTDSRCFVATCVFGPNAPRTNALRHWRDRCLAPTALGAALVATYYAISPGLVWVLRRAPRLRCLVRSALARWVAHLEPELTHKPASTLDVDVNHPDSPGKTVQNTGSMDT